MQWSSAWRKVARPQFAVMVGFIVLLVVAENTGLRIPADLKAAITAAVVGWIGAETWLDNTRAKAVAEGRKGAGNET